jgi:hypothetical protein
MPEDPFIAGGISFSLSNPRATAYLVQHGAELIDGIDETTRAAIHDILVQGSQQGWSYDKVAKAIRGQFEEFGAPTPYKHLRTRAHLIAVNEQGHACEESNLMQARELQSRGLPMEKLWVTVGDEGVSDGCARNAAAGWIPLERPFPSGHMRPLRYEGCRCAAHYRRLRSGA